MVKRISIRANSHLNNRRQALTLLVCGVICLLLAWLLHLNPFAQPIGVLVFGLCALIAFFLNPYRLAIVGWMMTFIGIDAFFVYTNTIPGNQILGTFFIAAALGLLAVALMARRGYVKAGAVSPAIIIGIVGIIEYLINAHVLPFNDLAFPLSLWFPGIGLLLFGLFYYFRSGRSR